MNNLILSNTLTMSSREIAKLADKNHSHVLRDIKVMVSNLYEVSLDDPVLDHGLNQKVIIQRDSRGYISNIDLDMEHSLCLTSGYSARQRMAIIKRWNELENKQQNIISLPNFNNPAEAARAWADEVERNQQLLITNQEQTKKIESLESLFKHGETIPQFCKKLNGVNVMMVCSYLFTKGWLYNESKTKLRWRVKSYARDRYLTEEPTVIDQHGEEPFTVNTPVLLKAGAAKLYDMYLKNELPMKKTWDGLYTQDKELRVVA